MTKPQKLVKVPITASSAVISKKTEHLRTTFKAMVLISIAELKSRKGSSLPAIKKYMAATYKIDAVKQAHLIRKALKSSLESGELVQTSGKGCSGSFRISLEAKKEVAKKAKTEQKTTKKAETNKKNSMPSKIRAPPAKKAVAPAKAPAEVVVEPVRKSPKKRVFEQPAVKPRKHVFAGSNVKEAAVPSDENAKPKTKAAAGVKSKAVKSKPKKAQLSAKVAISVMELSEDDSYELSDVVFESMKEEFMETEEVAKPRKVMAEKNQ